MLSTSCSWVRSFDDLSGGDERCGAPFAQGWTQIPKTKLASVCPLSDIDGRCHEIGDEGSAIADTRRCRMVVWGGNSAYTGNEVYAFELRTRTVQRLNEPSAGASFALCDEELPDGTPGGRAVYDGLAYDEHAGQMLAISGERACQSHDQSNATWGFDLETQRWTKLSDVLDLYSSWSTAYDPGSRKVYAHNDYSLYAYDRASDKYATLNQDAQLPIGQTAVVDTRDHWLFFFGGGIAGGIHAFDIGPNSEYSMTEIPATGCEALVQSTQPGLAYVPLKNKIVGWIGGAKVFVFDPSKNTCAEMPPGGEGGAIPPSPTKWIAGRFRYFPEADVFVAIPSASDDVWVLRLEL